MSSPEKRKPPSRFADRRHHVGRRSGLERLVHRQRGFETRGFVLREVLHDDLMAHDALTGVWSLLAGQQTHQRRLAGTVRSDQRDAIAALDVQIDLVSKTLSAPYAFDARFISSTVRPLFGACGKAEVNALSLGRHLDRHDLLEHLDAALYLRGLRGLVAEAVDEHLHARDFFVLLAFGLPQAFEHGVALLDVLAVVADVVGQSSQVNVGDARDDGIEEVAVVRDEDHGVRIGTEILLEPVACLEIEVVGRLVEQQQVRTSEQQLGERDAHLPAAGERFARTVAVFAARIRGRAARSRCAGPCCSLRRAGIDPEARRSATSIASCSSCGIDASPSLCSMSCISAFMSSSG